MRRPARTLPALLLLAAILGCMAFRPGPARPAAAAPLFRTADEARAFVVARVLAAERIEPALDVYVSTYWRTGDEGPQFLVADPERELRLAESFAEHRFHREAMVHLENLVTYHAGSPQARVAAKRLAACRTRTLLGLVPPESPIFELDGELRVPATSGSRLAEGVDLDRLLARLHEPFLLPAPAGTASAVVGRVDEHGECRYEAPVAAPSGGPAWRLPPGCRSLHAAERQAKRALLDRHLDGHPEASPFQARLTEALVYLGYVDEARERAHRRDESLPENPLGGDLQAIAADPAHPLSLDARWLLKLDQPPKTVLAATR
jgi:hypothetical protein